MVIGSSNPRCRDFSKLLKYVACLTTSDIVLSSDSVDERAVQSWRDDFQMIGPPHNVKTIPVVDLGSSVTFPQSAPQNPIGWI